MTPAGGKGGDRGVQKGGKRESTRKKPGPLARVPKSHKRKKTFLL